ncbi:PREDICTED: synaptic vesicle glycoprotein 2B-like [Polistes dominula]|uniref:Synaptic vesicle glycoprotein 2B-like n=1 Tax=Polistes dominula TaxID=743375 RepID=A0ABM1INE6_POLDO|nr:PREDICTED: synaptic vesicle glycoprotein 2B-like [Polistes dominula]
MPPNSTVSAIDMNKKKSISDRNNSCVQDTKLPPADFESAVNATGYGKFHVLLYLAIIPVSWASSFDTGNISVILPAAECDLQLSLIHKGILNAVVYIGMVSSGLIWGYLADVRGRKSILVYGFMADGVCNVLSGFSQNFETLLFFKFLSGAIISGPYAGTMTYYAEFYGAKVRSRITLIVGFTVTAGTLMTSALAWLVIPQTWSIVLWDGYFVYDSWRIFLSLCGVPTLIGVFLISFFPESPKFLMSQGRKEEALKVFRQIYRINTGKPEETYPITELADDFETNSSTDLTMVDPSKKSFKSGLLQMKPIFFRPHILRLILILTLQFCSMLSLNTIRLWQPQLFSILNDFNPIDNNITDHEPAFCEILDIVTYSKNTNVTSDMIEAVDCSNIVISEKMYTDSTIVSMSTISSLFIASMFVNLLGHKILLYICYTVCVSSLISMIWSTSYTLTLTLTCLFVGIMMTSLNIIVGVTVLLFPTTLRTMAVSLVMIIGRSGSLIGNVVFPVLLEYGCIAPIMTIACFPLLGIVLAFFIPSSKIKKNKNVESG